MDPKTIAEELSEDDYRAHVDVEIEIEHHDASISDDEYEHWRIIYGFNLSYDEPDRSVGYEGGYDWDGDIIRVLLLDDDNIVLELDKDKFDKYISTIINRQDRIQIRNNIEHGIDKAIKQYIKDAEKDAAEDRASNRYDAMRDY